MSAPPGSAATPATHAYRTTVARAVRLSDHFIRITVTCPELAHFGPPDAAGGTSQVVAAWDQRIKLFFPRDDGTFPDLGLFADPAPTVKEWYGIWRQLEESQRNPIRTYTVRSIRPEACEIDVDFVVHGMQQAQGHAEPETPAETLAADDAAGPAALWAVSAQPGDELIIVGPDRRSTQSDGGIEWNPGTARDILLAGDETAVPAICAIVETLPDEYTGEAYLEVPVSGDQLSVEAPAGVAVHWLPRDGRPMGERLTGAVRDWGRRRAEIFEARRRAWEPARTPVGAPAGTAEELPEVDDEATLWEVADPEGFREYAWLAGEAGVITSLRRHLVKEVGMSRRQVSFMGYWKYGRAAT